MNPKTKEALERLNAQFYSFHANSFSNTRSSAWDSWAQLIDSALDCSYPSSVLDVGCGNARFLDALNEAGLRDLSYLGLDPEPQLLKVAKERFAEQSFEVGAIADVAQFSDSYQWVVCFGVLHHIGGFEERTGAIKTLSDALKESGVLMLSFWQPKMLENFSNKTCIPDEQLDLEKNDFLLSWEGDCSTPRYCHHFDDEEIDSLIEHSQLKVISRIQGTRNDQTNQYVLLTN